MSDEIQSLLDQYWAWLRDRTSLREAGDWVEITTPYLDHHNDCLQIYAKRSNGGFELIRIKYSTRRSLPIWLPLSRSKK